MTAMTNVAVPVDEWTLAYTASGSVTLGIQNRGSGDMLVRIGTTAATTDDAGAAADVLMPGETRSYPLINTDKVILRPLRATSGALAANLRV